MTTTISIQEYQQLKEDFEYNLSLLQDRDVELQNYETTFVNFQTVLKERDETIRSNNRLVEELQMKVKRQTSLQQEQVSRHRLELQHTRAQIGEAIQTQDVHANDLRTELKQVKPNPKKIL